MAIDYVKRPKIVSGPKIDVENRVIHFGDDQRLFKIVSQLILDRVDHGRVDHGRGTSAESAAKGDHDSGDRPRRSLLRFPSVSLHYHPTREVG